MILHPDQLGVKKLFSLKTRTDNLVEYRIRNKHTFVIVGEVLAAAASSYEESMTKAVLYRPPSNYKPINYVSSGGGGGGGLG